MDRPAEGELPTRDTGDINFSVTGIWRGGDEHGTMINLKIGESFPACPKCGRDITWTYVSQ